MKKIAYLLIVSILALSIFSGCSGNNGNKTTSPEKNETITITDHNDNKVTLPTEIDRIAVCDILPLPSVLTIFFDSADKIVSMSPTSMTAAKNGLLSELYPEILKVDTSAVNGTDVNTEELMKLDPQIVFYNASNEQIGETLRKSGFNAVAISVNKWDYNCIETLNQWIDLLSEIFPDSSNDRAKLVREYSEDSMLLIRERTEKLSDEERKKIFFLFQYTDESILTSGQHFFGQWWADSVGAINAATELDNDNSAKVTMEQIYSWNPEMILMTNFTTAFPDDLYNNAVGNYDWSGIKAVEDRAVHKMPLGMYRSYTPGVDTPITLLWLAKTVYPELFEDIDITEKTVEYYEKVFNVRLTEKQAESIFAPSSDAGKTDF